MNLLIKSGTKVPTWDITVNYESGNVQDMLVNSQRFGSSLARTFSNSEASSPDSNVVLMANHGFTTVGNSIQQAVYRAVYTRVNAGVQSNAIMLRNAFDGVKGNTPATKDIKYLDEQQTIGTMTMNDSSQDRPWGLWVREVEACPLYMKKGF